MLLAEFLDLYGMINSSLNEILVQLWSFIRDLMDCKTCFLLSVGIGWPDSTLQRVCTQGSSVICSSIIKDMWWSDVTFLSVIFTVVFCWHSYGFAENAKRGVVFIMKDLRLRSLFEPQETGAHLVAMTSMVIWQRESLIFEVIEDRILPI